MTFLPAAADVYSERGRIRSNSNTEWKHVHIPCYCIYIQKCIPGLGLVGDQPSDTESSFPLPEMHSAVLHRSLHPS